MERKWGQEDGGLCTGYFVREDGVEDFTFLDLLLLTHISISLLRGGRQLGWMSVDGIVKLMRFLKIGMSTQIKNCNRIASLAEWSKAVDLSSFSTLLSKDA